MSYIYTSAPVPSRTIQSPEFQKRDIEGTTGKLGQIHMIGIPAEKQPAYDGYVSNLPAFLHATAIGARVAAKHIWFKALLAVDKILPLGLPPLVVQPKRPLKTEEAKETFKQSLGFTPEVVRGPTGESYVCRTPSFTTLRNMPKGINAETPSTPDSTSYFGMLSYVMTLRIISLFLSTHTYPAFQTADQKVASFEKDTDIYFAKKGWIPTGKWRGSADLYEDIDIEGIDMSKEANFAAGLEEYQTGVFNRLSGSDGVFVAKPAPLRPEVNYGLPSAIPNLPGFVYPYFHGIIEPAKDTIVQIMSQYFLGCFGNSNEDAANEWSNWIRGLDKWYKTAHGKEVAHILFGIRLALQSQSRLFLIITSAGYKGFCLLGYKFTIWHEGRSLLPNSSKVLKDLVGDLDLHQKAMTDIIAILQKLKLRDSEMVIEESLSTSMSARQLFQEINRREKAKDDILDVLVERVGQLTFTETLWPLTVENLTRWISLLSSSDPISMDFPMYLSPDLIYNTSRMHQILAAFGPTAPSLLDAAGSEFPIPKGLTDADTASEEDPATKKLRLPSILVSMKKLSVAINDGENVVKKRRIRQNHNERAAGFRTVRFTGEGRAMIWNHLKLLPFEVEKDKGKKRAREEEDTGEGSSKKKKKREEISILDVLVERVGQLTFTETLWPLTVENLTRWISLLSSSDPISMDFPMYLSPDLIYNTSRMHQILAAFGPTAPSLLDAAGSEFPIPKGLTDADTASEEDPATKKLRLPSILVSMKKLSVAINDGENVVKKRRIRQNHNERAAGFRTVRFTGEGRAMIWNHLKLLPFEVEKDKGKKRAREEEDTGEGSSKKKKAKDTDEDDDIVDSSFFD